MSQPEVVERPETTPGGRPGIRRPAVPRGGWGLLAGLYVVACGVYLVLAQRVALPSLYPDSIRYSHLARSLADGHGFDWRGEDVRQSAALYVYLITPMWMLFRDTVDAFHATKALGTVVLCLQVVPVWLLGREMLGPRLALVPAALSVAGTWMLSAAEVATETLAYPLATAALCVAVLALRRPGSRLGWLALALILLAVWARIQLAVLIPALLVAYVVDAARRPAERTARLRADQALLAVLAAMSVVLVVVALAAPSVTGDYAGFFDLRPSLASIARRSGLQLLELVVLSGLLPVLLAGGATFSGRVWRDDRTGPLLAVLWTSAAATALQSGFFLAGFPPVPTGIQRYVTFAVPLAFVLFTVLVSDRRLLTRRVMLTTAALGLVLLALPATTVISDERAIWALGDRVDAVIGLDHGLALTLVALVVAAVLWALITRLRRPMGAALAAAGLVLAVLAVQDQAAWQQLTRLTRSERAQLPADLRWVDHSGRGGVALLGVTVHAPLFYLVDYFNRDVDRVYAPEGGLPGKPPQGRICTWSAGSDGTVELQPDCGAAPRRFWVNDPWVRVRFHDEASSVSDPRLGRIVTTSTAGPPRLQSIIVLPCPPHPTPSYSETAADIPPADAPFDCRPQLAGSLWLDQGGELRIRFEGGREDHAVSAGQQSWSLPAGRATTVAFPVPAGSSQFVLGVDWTTNIGTPRVAAAELRVGGQDTNLL